MPILTLNQMIFTMSVMHLGGRPDGRLWLPTRNRAVHAFPSVPFKENLST